jgi:hypothetical protein
MHFALFFEGDEFEDGRLKNQGVVVCYFAKLLDHGFTPILRTL